MTRFFVQLPAGDTMTLDLDLDTTTVAAVKATVDAHLESIWRASGVRILRSDVPFCGIRLRYQNRLLAMDKLLSSCEVGKESTLYAQWPRESEKHERRKRYGKGWGDKPVLKGKMKEERELKTTEKEELSAEKNAPHGAAKRWPSEVVGNAGQSAPEIGQDEQIPSELRSDDRLDEGTKVEAGGDCVDAGGQGAQNVSEEVPDEEQDEQQVDVEEQEERPTEEIEQDDPFADEDDNKENQEPVSAPVVEARVDDNAAEEWPVFDESHGGLGMDLREEVLDF